MLGSEYNWKCLFESNILVPGFQIQREAQHSYKRSK